MENCLIRMLDYALKDCKKSIGYANRKTAYDHAFGMLVMACAYDPSMSSRYEKLWYEVYSPQFEKLVYDL